MKAKTFKNGASLISWDDFVVEEYKNPVTAQNGLRSAIEEFAKDGHTKAFLATLRAIAQAQGGISKLASKTKISKQALHKALSDKGNPTIHTLFSIIFGLGFKLEAKLDKPKAKSKKHA